MLENFRIKTENEYNALTPEEKGEYNALKRMFDTEQARKEKEATKAELKAELDASLTTKLAEVKAEAKAEAVAEFESKITAVKDEYDRKLEDAEKAMKESKGYGSERVDTLESKLYEKFDKADDKKQFVKELLSGKIEIETEASDISKTITKPSGSTAPQFIESVWNGHDTFYARQLVANLGTIRDTIKFNQYSVDNSKAGIGGVVENALKPEFGWNLTPKSEAIIKLAGWVDYTEEMEDDVEGFMRELPREAILSYYDVFDYQFFKGNGNQTTELNGLWTTSPNQTFPMGLVDAGANVIDKMVAGVTQIRKNHRGATSFVVSPEVWQEIYLNKDSQQAYTYPILLNARGELTLGGVPVYYSNVFTGMEGIVGDFQRGARVYTKKGLSIRISSENVDNFVHNRKTLLVEAREAVVKRYADGFLKLNLDGSAS